MDSIVEVSQKDQWRVVALGPPLGSTIGSRALACAQPGNIVIAFKFCMPCKIQPQQPLPTHQSGLPAVPVPRQVVFGVSGVHNVVTDSWQDCCVLV